MSIRAAHPSAITSTKFIIYKLCALVALGWFSIIRPFHQTVGTLKSRRHNKMKTNNKLKANESSAYK